MVLVSVRCLTLPPGATQAPIPLAIFLNPASFAFLICNDMVWETFEPSMQCRHWTNWTAHTVDVRSAPMAKIRRQVIGKWRESSWSVLFQLIPMGFLLQ